MCIPLSFGVNADNSPFMPIRTGFRTTKVQPYKYTRIDVDYTQIVSNTLLLTVVDNSNPLVHDVLELNNFVEQHKEVLDEICAKSEANSRHNTQSDAYGRSQDEKALIRAKFNE